MPTLRHLLPFLLTALTVLPWASAGGAESRPSPEIEYVSPDQSVWTIRTNRNGEPDNPLLAVADALFAKAGLHWRYRSYPTVRMLKYLQDGSAPFSMLVKSPPLQGCCLLSRKPLTRLEIRVYHLADKPAINNINELAGKNVISIHGYTYGELLGFLNDERNHITNNLAVTHPAAFRMLARQRADYVIDYVGPASEVLADSPIPGIQSEILTNLDVHLVLSKSYPDAVGLMNRLEAIADTLNVDKLMRTSRR